MVRTCENLGEHVRPGPEYACGLWYHLSIAVTTSYTHVPRLYSTHMRLPSRGERLSCLSFLSFSFCAQASADSPPCGCCRSPGPGPRLSRTKTMLMARAAARREGRTMWASQILKNLSKICLSPEKNPYLPRRGRGPTRDTPHSAQCPERAPHATHPNRARTAHTSQANTGAGGAAAGVSPVAWCVCVMVCVSNPRPRIPSCDDKQ
jgi:hypothetical protein